MLSNPSPIGPNINNGSITDRFKLLHLIRNRLTPSDNLRICRECLRQNENDPQKALKTLSELFPMASAGAPSEALKQMLQSEAIKQKEAINGIRPQDANKKKGLSHSLAENTAVKFTE